MLLAGTATFSGDGVRTAFSFAIGLNYIPTLIQVTAGSRDAMSTTGGTVVNSFWVDPSIGPGFMSVTFLNAPDSGTNNVVLYWTIS